MGAEKFEKRANGGGEMAGYGSCIKNYSNLINSLDRRAGAVLIVIGGQ